MTEWDRDDNRVGLHGQGREAVARDRVPGTLPDRDKRRAAGSYIDFHIARKIAQRRLDMELSRVEVAAAAGCDVARIAEIETRVLRLSVTEMVRIAAALNTPLHYFYEGLADQSRLLLADGQKHPG
ncbi:MAG TPA: helix-turn-helix transcriptional regulator [Hyphomicrobiaceae bacterium]|nr:helix-turn-helix transcriptional regulator [Hyphomicrobiaceae bacterium]